MLFYGQKPTALRGKYDTHRQSTLEIILNSCSTQNKNNSKWRGREGDSTLSSRISSRRWSTVCLKPLKKSYSMLIWQTKCWNFWDNDNDKLSSHEIWMGSIESAPKHWGTAAANKMWRSNCCRHRFAYVTLPKLWSSAAPQIPMYISNLNSIYIHT